MISRSSDILILGSAGGHFELWRPSCINKYSLVYEMKLSEIKYIISGILIIILFPKSPFVHFLLKRKGGILYFNGHVTYDLPKNPKITLSSKWHFGISKPELRAKKTHFYDCRDCIHSRLLFCGGHFGNMQIS